MELQDSMEQQGSVQSGAIPGADVGAMLREARERMGMSVDEVAGRLKFAPRQVAALEAGDFGQLPELAFVRGFVRSYARLVQLDEKALLDALPGAPAPAAIQVRASRNEVPHQGAERIKQNLFWLGAAVVVVVVGILAWKYDVGESRSGGTQVAPSATTESAPEAQTGTAPQNAPVAPTAGMQPSAQPGRAVETPATAGTEQPGEAPAGQAAPAAEAPPAKPAKPAVTAEKGAPAHNGEKKPAHAATHGAASGASGVAATTTMAHVKPHHAQQAASGVSATGTGAPQALGPSRMVHLEFTEDSWVEVRDGTGKILLSMLGKQGTSRNAAGPTPLLVVVGNAKGVKLYYKGQPVALQPIAGSGVARLKLE